MFTFTRWLHDTHSDGRSPEPDSAQANTMIVHDRFATLQTFGQSIIVLLQPRLISSDTLLNGTTLESLRSIIMGPFPCRSCDPPESWYRNYLDDRGNGLPGFNDHNM